MITYVTFTDEVMGFTGLSYKKIEALRLAAMHFINTQIGAENVVAVNEYFAGHTIFIISVWYRARPYAQNSLSTPQG